MLQRLLWRLVAPLIIALVAFAAPASAQDRLGGVYKGIDMADGMTVTVHGSGAGYSGVMHGADGRSYPFQAQPDGLNARGRVQWESGAGNFIMTPHPAGMLMTWMPVDANGAPVPGRTAMLAFIREGMSVPKPPERIAEPPSYLGQKVDAMVFLDNYEFWEPDAVAIGYVGVLGKYRSLFEMFPRVQADILWKLCEARSVGGEALAEALRGQGVTCNEVVTSITNAQRRGLFPEFKRTAGVQRADLFRAVECARGMGTPEKCRRVAQTTQQAALSMETVASYLRQFR